MRLLTPVPEHTTPTHPTLDPVVMEKGRELEAARVALSALEVRSRELERDRDSSDELRVLNAAHELHDLRQTYIACKAAVLTTQRAYDAALRAAQIPWQAHWRAHYREAAERWLTFLETDALAENTAMLRAQEEAEAAGLHVDPLSIAHLTADAVGHRCKVGRKGLG